MLNQPVVRTIAAIALGAIAGALSRYYLVQGLTQMLGTHLPYGTLVVNISGCFAMGLLATLFLGPVITVHPDLRLLLLTGFLGSYTTFSSYELDSARLLMEERFQAELIYWGGSALVGFFSLQGGMTLANWLVNQVERHWFG
ncbi:MAG TPA: fluoride efflux transporter CrcB [Leptolyngbyaceae cyanobacterium M65_K2018_010]|nr:fluoride efflux transporter CrcB [Leptolyngbyaceae cyanobacterium M65_K2018_010]